MYDWPEIDRAAVQHAIEPSDLRDYAFDYVTEELTAQQLIDAYRAAEEIE